MILVVQWYTALDIYLPTRQLSLMKQNGVAFRIASVCQCPNYTCLVLRCLDMSAADDRTPLGRVLSMFWQCLYVSLSLRCLCVDYIQTHIYKAPEIVKRV